MIVLVGSIKHEGGVKFDNQWLPQIVIIVTNCMVRASYANEDLFGACDALSIICITITYQAWKPVLLAGIQKLLKDKGHLFPILIGKRTWIVKLQNDDTVPIISLIEISS